MTVAIPEHLAAKTRAIPESSYGAQQVAFILSDGRRISGVVLAWGSEIVRIGGRDITSAADLHFKVEDIADIIRES